MSAYSGEEGLALAQQQRPDVIILDSVESKDGEASQPPVLLYSLGPLQ